MSADLVARLLYCFAFAIAAGQAGWPLLHMLAVVLAVNVTAIACERLLS